MYYKIKDGTKVSVYGIECWIPPVGFGKDKLTGELVEIGVHKRSEKESEQYWERLKLPEDYAIRRAKEEAIQEQQSDDEPMFVDWDLEEIRQKHWTYRRCGHWFMNNGVPTYITGTNWLYLNWCQTNIGFMSYRKHDRLLFYAWASVEEDPRSGGLVYITRRRAGKTYIAAAIQYDRVTLAKNKIGGSQSKTDDDSKSIYDKIVNYFTGMPHFFRPNYDFSKGTRPTKELRFFKPSVKGKLAVVGFDTEELKSVINYGSSTSYHYDGQALYSYILDEFGKPQKSNTWETWQVVRYCLDQDGVWVGKAFVTSTIEDMDVTGEAPKKIWKMSDQNTRDANGQTASGLYRVFFGAHETTFLPGDTNGLKYGEPDENKNIEFYNNRREGKKNDPRALSAEKRKNPFTIEEAFIIDGEKCIYNPGLLNDRATVLSWKKNVTTRGNFSWQNGERDTKVVFTPHEYGKFEVCMLFDDESKSNRFIKRGDMYHPDNAKNFVMGVDPFDHNIAEDGKMSDGACIIKSKFDATSNDIYNDAFVCAYSYRAQSAHIFYEDMLMAACYYGCPILFENQKVNMMHYFNDRGYGKFLMWLPDRLQPGIAASAKTIQQIAELTEDYINNSIDRVYFKKLIEQWLEFDINKTTKFDLAIAAGYCLMADKIVISKQDKEKLYEVSELFNTKKGKNKRIYL